MLKAGVSNGHEVGKGKKSFNLAPRIPILEKAPDPFFLNDMCVLSKRLEATNRSAFHPQQSAVEILNKKI